MPGSLLLGSGPLEATTDEMLKKTTTILCVSLYSIFYTLMSPSLSPARSQSHFLYFALVLLFRISFVLFSQV